MATNLCSRSRAKYVKVKDFAEQFAISKAQAYRILDKPEFAEAVIKTGEKGKAVNLDKAFEIMQQYFR